MTGDFYRQYTCCVALCVCVCVCVRAHTHTLTHTHTHTHTHKRAALSLVVAIIPDNNSIPPQTCVLLVDCSGGRIDTV